MTTAGTTSGAGKARVRRRQRAISLYEEATVEVLRHGYGAGDEVRRIRVPKFTTEPAWVRVEGSVTRNMGDFNSVRVAVMLEVPCLPVEEDLDRTYQWASTFVEDKLQSELRVAVGG